MGLGGGLEAEGKDRLNLTLPPAQQQLLDAVSNAVAKGGGTLVVVVVSAGPVRVPLHTRITWTRLDIRWDMMFVGHVNHVTVSLLIVQQNHWVSFLVDAICLPIHAFAMTSLFSPVAFVLEVAQCMCILLHSSPPPSDAMYLSRSRVLSFACPTFLLHDERCGLTKTKPMHCSTPGT